MKGRERGSFPSPKIEDIFESVLLSKKIGGIFKSFSKN
jgi:hypothetical protein